MSTYPKFPDFKMLTLQDRSVVHEHIWVYQPETSELTFTNLYIWRSHFDFRWCIYDDWLLIVGKDGFALPPVGPASRVDVTRMLLRWLKEEQGIAAPRIQRADQRLLAELKSAEDFVIAPTRDHFDYVYTQEDLATLSGRKYSKKRNHINKFLRLYEYTYEPLTENRLDECLALAEVWCQRRQCEDDLSLMHEWEGARDALTHFRELNIDGGLILVDGEVRAFSLGERLNKQTAVVHIEKANLDFEGIYPMINQEFVQHAFEDVSYINREQDLGIPGLRRAKESYYPDHLVEKFEVAHI